MNSIAALSQLVGLNQNWFKTADAAACWQISRAHASKRLARLASAGQVCRIQRAHWALSKSLDILEAISVLGAPWPSYISLHTALFYHGMIAQIPVTAYAVTLGRTRSISSPLGRISFHHVQPDFFFGFVPWGGKNILLAEPEKALIDHLYLKPARSGLFQTLPELTLTQAFSLKKARAIIRKISSQRRRTLVEKNFLEIIKNSS